MDTFLTENRKHRNNLADFKLNFLTKPPLSVASSLSSAGGKVSVEVMSSGKMWYQQTICCRSRFFGGMIRLVLLEMHLLAKNKQTPTSGLFVDGKRVFASDITKKARRFY